MALIFPHHSPLPSSLNKPLSCFNLRGKPFIPNPSFSPSFSNPRPTLTSLTSRAPPVSSLWLSPLIKTLIPTNASSSETAFEPDDLAGDEDLAASPWEGAVVYRCDASAGNVEYCTTLKRLGLGRLSTGLSKSRASAMGIRVPVKTAKSSVSGDAETPVLVSVDVTRRKRRLKLDGILKHPWVQQLCNLVSLQRYTKALSSQQRASLVEKSRQKPLECIRVVTDVVKNNRYDEDRMLSLCGVSIEKKLTHLDGRVLNAPTRVKTPVHIKVWAIVIFSARCDTSFLSREL